MLGKEVKEKPILTELVFPKICKICRKAFLNKCYCRDIWKAKQEIKEKEVK